MEPPWDGVVIQAILKYLPIADALTLTQVCQKFRKVARLINPIYTVYIPRKYPLVTIYRAHLDGTKHGKYHTFLRRKILKSCEYKEGKLHGAYLEKYAPEELLKADVGDDPPLKVTCSFSDGLLHGEYRSYYRNGYLQADNIPREISNYHLGKPHGARSEYSRKALLIRKSNYRHGVRHGSVETYYPEQTAIREKYTCNNGKMHGEYWSYLVTGEINFRRSMVNGVPHGYSTYYSLDGEIVSQVRYHHGVRVVTTHPEEGSDVIHWE